MSEHVSKLKGRTAMSRALAQGLPAFREALGATLEDAVDAIRAEDRCSRALALREIAAVMTNRPSEKKLARYVDGENSPTVAATLRLCAWAGDDRPIQALAAALGLAAVRVEGADEGGRDAADIAEEAADALRETGEAIGEALRAWRAAPSEASAQRVQKEFGEAQQALARLLLDVNGEIESALARAREARPICPAASPVPPPARPARRESARP